MDIILLGIKNTPIIIKEMEFIHIYVILKKIWKRKKLFTYKKIYSFVIINVLYKII